ncbi:hypothetical protein DEU56DRAFT_699584, partial [Suillus clintonianus]|uniref:uncharacterized protein n=1 Tax=Suillus clintonianus TaxID=1904413 RepID=UPI001B85F98C
PSPPSDNCPGIAVVWPDDLRPFLMLFPWGRYHSGPDALPYTIDITQPSAPRARSKYCTHTRFQGSACDECTDVHRHILHLSEIARDPKHHTNYKYLGLGHLQDIAKTYAEQIKMLKLQELNHSRRYLRSLTQLDDYSRLLMAISEKDIPRIHQIIDVALRHGSSVREIVNKLEDALEGAYSPRGYDANDLDIATLIFRL